MLFAAMLGGEVDALSIDERLVDDAVTVVVALVADLDTGTIGLTCAACDR